MIIYKITNKINGKCYVGQTTGTLQRRWSRHCAKDNRCTHLARAIKKYGKENFKIEEIDSAETMEKLNELEIYYIKECNSLAPNGYNLTTGGNEL